MDQYPFPRLEHRAVAPCSGTRDDEPGPGALAQAGDRPGNRSTYNTRRATGRLFRNNPAQCEDALSKPEDLLSLEPHALLHLWLRPEPGTVRLRNRLCRQVAD